MVKTVTTEREPAGSEERSAGKDVPYGGLNRKSSLESFRSNRSTKSLRSKRPRRTRSRSRSRGRNNDRRVDKSLS